MPPMKFRILVNIHLNLFILFHLHVGLLSNKITLLVHTPGLFFSNGKIGCRECRNVNTLGLHAKQRSHISKEWIECTVFFPCKTKSRETSAAQKYLTQFDPLILISDVCDGKIKY